MRHAFRNALIPLMTVIALNFGALIGGAVVTETVFASTGWASTSSTRSNSGDPYPVMAWLMIVSAAIIIFNLLADIAYGFSTRGCGMTDLIRTPEGAKELPQDGPGGDELPDPLHDLELAHESGVSVKPRSQWAYVRTRFFRHRLAVASLIILIFLVLLAIFAKRVSPYAYDELDLFNIAQAPTRQRPSLVRHRPARPRLPEPRDLRPADVALGRDASSLG